MIFPILNRLSEVQLAQVAVANFAGADRWGYANNRIHVNENVDVTGASAPIANGLVVEVYPGIGGTNKSNVISFVAAVTLEAGATIDTSNPLFLDIVGAQSYAKASRNWGGTNTGAGAKGGLFGHNIVVINDTTNVLGLIGCELDVQTFAGSSQARRFGFNVVDFLPSNSQGASYDAAYGVSASGGAVGWLNGILFSDSNGGPPLDATNGSILKTQGAATIKNGIDLSSYTITNLAFSSTGYAVDGSGAVTVGNGLGVTAGIHIVNGGLSISLGGLDCTGTTTFHDGIRGTATNDAAAALCIGQLIASSVLVAAGVALTNVTEANVTSISVTAGDWDIEGWVWFDFAGTTALSILQASVSTTSATRPTTPDGGPVNIDRFAAYVPGSPPIVMPTGRMRFSFAATTTVYLVALAAFSASTCKAYGRIEARRVR